MSLYKARLVKSRESGPASLRRLQVGVITTFTGVLVLVMLGMMMFFAVRVGIMDQRVSSNDLQQKRAFHSAESAIQHAKEYFRANSVIAASKVTDLLPNGTDGWLSPGAERWQRCSAAGLNLAGTGTHPCFGEPNPARRANLYYYSFANSTNVPVDTNALIPGTTEEAAVQALLCVLEIDYDEETPVQGCNPDADGLHFMITLLGRGRADCDGTECRAEAMISEQVSNFGGTAGGNSPSVPLVTKSTFPPSGAAEIVPNPNSGGVGVPVSVWMNANPRCSADGSIIEPSSGSWATCEAHEWYGEDMLPDDYTCNGSCSCSVQESISNTHGTDDVLGIDLVQDPDFPCDLFDFFFGVPRTSYEIVKGYSKVLSDCSTLGPNSTGIFWITGNLCTIASNTQVGSPQAPILLISAAGELRLQGGTTIYGVLYLSDAEVAAASLTSNGTTTVYGQVIVDGTMGNYNGTFQVIYNEFAISRASGQGGLGAMIGGWADFHADWK